MLASMPSAACPPLHHLTPPWSLGLFKQPAREAGSSLPLSLYVLHSSWAVTMRVPAAGENHHLGLQELRARSTAMIHTGHALLVRRMQLSRGPGRSLLIASVLLACCCPVGGPVSGWPKVALTTVK